MTDIKKKGKGKGKKLQLHKETIKDLTDREGKSKGGLIKPATLACGAQTQANTLLNCCVAHG